MDEPQRPPCRFDNLQVLKEVIAVNQGAAEVGGGVQNVDLDQLNAAAQEGAKEAGLFFGVDGAEGGVEQMAEELVADEIVKGHQYFE